MKMSTKGRYGLRVMMELATRYGKGPVLAEAISKNQEISEKYIHVLVNNLRSAGIARSVRGPSGGYELARSPGSITAFDVVSALEGKSTPVDCVADASVCSRSRKCATRDIWCDIASAVDKVLTSITLEQLVEKQKAKQQEPDMYFI